MSNHHYDASGPQPPWALRRSNLHLGDEPDLDLHRHLHQHQHDQQHQHQQQRAEQQNDAPWPVPNPDIMAERWRHRHHILGETAAHLLVHPHGGLGVTGRNVLHVLYDRQVRGPAAITCRAHWKRSHNLGIVHPSGNPHHENDSNNTNSDFSMGEEDQDSDKEEDSSSDDRRGLESNMPKSPSTVLLETSGTEPMETNDSPTSYDESQVRVAEHVQQHAEAHPEDETPQPPPFYKDQVLSDYFQRNSNSNSTNSRFLPYPMSVARELRTFGEYAAATKYHSAFLTHLGGDEDTLQHRPASSRAVSTISVAFSPDGRTLASTHGDHTVKISCCETGRLCQSLEGHPRTPWTVKYHPTNADIVASGCLGHQVRVWNWREKICLQMVRLEFAIISLAFHPTGQLLAIANGTRLHFWGVGKNVDKTNENNVHSSTDNHSNNNTLLLLEMDHRHMLRCVHFPPGGDTLIIGGVNQENDPRRRRPGSNGMSFYLRLWDFDLERTLAGSLMMMMGHNSGNGAAQVMPRGAISNSRTFVPRALLYNDGGFDISPDGKMLCACAEYWLPEGVDSAMDLLVKDEEAYDAENREQEIRQRLVQSPSAAVSTGISSSAGAPPAAAAPLPPQFLGGAMAQSSLSASDTKSAVSAALANLRGIVDANVATHGRSGSFREGMDQLFHQQSAGNAPPPRTPTAMDSSPERLSQSGTIPRTPPVTSETRLRNLSPPPPPGNRFGGTVSTSGGQPLPTQQPYFRQPLGSTNTRGISSPPPPPPVPPQAMPPGIAVRPPNPLSLVLSSIPTSNALQSTELYTRGRYVPHVVTVSLDTSRVPDDVRYIDESGSNVKNRTPCAVARGHRPRLGQLIEAHPLDANKAGAVTCVKFSPSTDFCLIGYGVREPLIEGIGSFHPVTAVFRVRGGMTHVSTTLSGDDDVNIARFHPDSGHSFVYGTKQGRVRVLSPRPWNFY